MIKNGRSQQTGAISLEWQPVRYSITASLIKWSLVSRMLTTPRVDGSDGVFERYGVRYNTAILILRLFPPIRVVVSLIRVPQS